VIGLAAVLTVGAAVPAAAAPARTARLVQMADGTLAVHHGQSFSGAGRVLVEEVDVPLGLALSPVSDLLDAETGLASDALRTEQWNLDEVAAETAWTASTGSGQVVAVIDTGIDPSHPDLQGRLRSGWSVTGSTADDHGHGTHVAGTIAAVAGNDEGVAGIAPDAELLPIRVAGADGSVYASDVAAGLIWAVEHGATIANLSLAGTQRSGLLDAAIDHAVARDVVVVVAAGNEYENGNPVTYPAAHPDVVAVAALRDATTRAGFSSTGDFVDLAAPGAAILSTRPRASYGYASGTSMAAPLVAGAAALLRAADPAMTAADVVAALTGSAVDLGDRGVDDAFGHGALDVVAALGAEAPVEEPVVEEPVVEEAPARDPMARQPVFTRSGPAFQRG
jgi:serine protease